MKSSAWTCLPEKRLTFVAMALGLSLLAAASLAEDATPGRSHESWKAPASPARAPAPGLAMKAETGDPVGDTFGAGALDLNRFGVFTSDANLILILGFASSVSPADSNQGDSLFGQIDLDTDQNPATGNPSAADTFCPLAAGIGVDARVLLGTYNSFTRQMDVEDSTIGTNSVHAVFRSNSVRITVPLAFLSGGIPVDASAVVGSPLAPDDCAPDGGFVTSSRLPTILEIPTLQGWALVLLGGSLLLMGLRRLRRRGGIG